MVYLKDEFLRPKAEYGIYPPYHRGLYLEEYFQKRWYEENIKSDRIYIDALWTNIYCNRSNIPNYFNFDLQKYLKDNLDWDKKYFTVCQHDDGPFEDLPEDTLIFSAGGNRVKGKIIPIPLICAAIPVQETTILEKNIFASFIGSMTHNIRQLMLMTLANKSDYFIKIANWNPNVTDENFKLFTNITRRSKFTLCPRGYGATSFRLYETLQLNSVPVYITDKEYKPWSDEINWNDFCILISEYEIPYMDHILKSISDEKYNKLLQNGKFIYEKYFTQEGMFQNIKKRII